MWIKRPRYRNTGGKLRQEIIGGKQDVRKTH